jgi:hypothetical protein
MTNEEREEDIYNYPMIIWRKFKDVFEKSLGKGDVL